jgi:hypothetical protein
MNNVPDSLNSTYEKKVIILLFLLQIMTVVTWREVSCSDGSPAADINNKKSTDSGGLKTQKIH